MKDWIIGICNTASDGVVMYRFRGDEADVKNKLCELVAEDRAKNEDTWDYGCEGIDDVEVLSNGHTYSAYASYMEHHIDYTAMEFASIEWK